MFASIFLSCNEPLFAGIWFLRLLIIASFLCFFMIKILDTRLKAVLGAWCLLFVSFVVSPHCKHVHIILYTYLPFLSSFFFFCGYIYHKYFEMNFTDKITSRKFCLIYILFLICAFAFWKSSMVNITTKKIIPFSLTAIMGIFFIMSICQRIQACKGNAITSYLKFLGSHTFDVLMMHIMSFKLVTFLIIVVYDLNFSDIASFPTLHEYTERGWFLLYLIVGVNLPLLIRFLFDKSLSSLRNEKNSIFSSNNDL